jgi:hypothetical protein
MTLGTDTDLDDLPIFSPICSAGTSARESRAAPAPRSPTASRGRSGSATTRVNFLAIERPPRGMWPTRGSCTRVSQEAQMPTQAYAAMVR